MQLHTCEVFHQKICANDAKQVGSLCNYTGVIFFTRKHMWTTQNGLVFFTSGDVLHQEMYMDDIKQVGSLCNYTDVMFFARKCTWMTYNRLVVFETTQV